MFPPRSGPSAARMACALGASAVLLALSGLGCGPSLRRVAASNEYFEQCHAADRDRTRSDEDRRACWVAWHAHYEVGQPQDRIDYARERIVTLDPRQHDAIELATGEFESSEAPPAQAALPEVGESNAEATGVSSGAEATTAPAESAPVAAVPEGAEVSSVLGLGLGDRERAPRVRRIPVLPVTHQSRCAELCAPDYRTCVTPCTVGDRGCVDACRQRFRTCAHACF